MPDSNEDRIRLRAYELWQSEGSPEGHDKEYWERAERELADIERVDRSEENAEVSPIPVPAGFPAH